MPKYVRISEPIYTVIFKQCYNLIRELEGDTLQGSVYHVDPTRIRVYKHSQYAIMKLHSWFTCNVTGVLSSGPEQEFVHYTPQRIWMKLWLWFIG